MDTGLLPPFPPRARPPSAQLCRSKRVSSARPGPLAIGPASSAPFSSSHPPPPSPGAQRCRSERETSILPCFTAMPRRHPTPLLQVLMLIPPISMATLRLLSLDTHTPSHQSPLRPHPPAPRRLVYALPTPPWYTGADVNTPDKYGDPPLTLAVMDGAGVSKTAAVKVLIDAGADVNQASTTLLPNTIIVTHNPPAGLYLW